MLGSTGPGRPLTYAQGRRRCTEHLRLLHAHTHQHGHTKWQIMPRKIADVFTRAPVLHRTLPTNARARKPSLPHQMVDHAWQRRPRHGRDRLIIDVAALGGHHRAAPPGHRPDDGAGALRCHRHRRAAQTGDIRGARLTEGRPEFLPGCPQLPVHLIPEAAAEPNRQQQGLGNPSAPFWRGRLRPAARRRGSGRRGGGQRK